MAKNKMTLEQAKDQMDKMVEKLAKEDIKSVCLLMDGDRVSMSGYGDEITCIQMIMEYLHSTYGKNTAKVLRKLIKLNKLAEKKHAKREKRA